MDRPANRSVCTESTAEPFQAGTHRLWFQKGGVIPYFVQLLSLIGQGQTGWSVIFRTKLAAGRGFPVPITIFYDEDPRHSRLRNRPFQSPGDRG